MGGRELCESRNRRRSGSPQRVAVRDANRVGLVPKINSDGYRSSVTADRIPTRGSQLVDIGVGVHRGQVSGDSTSEIWGDVHT